MQWKNVRLVFFREMRDQLRDRRTLFLIAVLPLLLYPLLGMSFFQLSQFMRHHAAKVLIVSESEIEQIDWLPPLLKDKQFVPDLFATPSQVENLEVVQADVLTGEETQDDDSDEVQEPSDLDAELPPEAILELARKSLQRGEIDVIVHFPTGFGAGLETARQAVLERESGETPEYPEPAILFNSTKEKSQIAQLRVEKVLQTWRSRIVQRNLSDSKVPTEATKPFELQPTDVASENLRRSAVWSKILPFVVLIWALTGAFYPAVDLCAGEKERGTLETLLTSPAQRREIVWGKLLTVMCFSITTALLNLVTLGLTAHFVVEQLRSASILPADRMPVQMPAVSSIALLTAALIPIAALFSALCLACAAFARSTKEGQYYLMPLMLVTMPLMLLPMSPGVELTLGNSLIPLTGLMLMLRSLFDGQLQHVLLYFVPVMGVTLVCCLLAIRWAEEQFNSESVLFRESERLDLGRWLTHLVRDRKETPTLAQAALCVTIILIAQFFVSLAMSGAGAEGLDSTTLAKAVFVPQLACILAPTLLMALVLTGNPLRTLLLERTPRLSYLGAAVLLAVFLHPISVSFTHMVLKLYPMPPGIAESAQALNIALLSAPWWQTIALLALLPACCEELAFRGFVLSGLRHLGHRWWAIGLSAVAFGGVHLFLQQKIGAAAVGLAIGYLAVQTGSLIPCIVFHALHNGIQISTARLANFAASEPGTEAWRPWIAGDQPWLYSTWSLGVCSAGAAAVFWRLSRISYQRTSEERLQEQRELQDKAFSQMEASQM